VARVPANTCSDQPSPLLISEHRFVRDPSGRIWTKTECDYAFWKPYVEVFGSLRVSARVSSVPDIPDGHRLADGEGVVFEALPTYIGPVGFALALFMIVWQQARSLRSAPLVILRGTGPLSLVAWPMVLAMGIAYGVEVLGDAEGVYRDGGVGGRLGWMYALIFGTFQRRVCWKASAVSYVTGTTLQSSYPNAAAHEFAVSDVWLPPSAILGEPRRYADTLPLHAILVGSLEQPYKGVDVALRAMRAMPDSRRAHLTILGDGRLRGTYEALAEELALTDDVRFAGSVKSGKAVIEHLDNADILIMPSLTEGMPRALLEGMARGLPALAARVGGIPELLGENAMFPRGDSAALARMLETMSPERLTAMSAANLHRSRDFSTQRLEGLHAAFLQGILELVPVSRDGRLSGRRRSSS